MSRLEAPPGTQAVVRALRLLRAFTPADPELSLAQLSLSLGLKKTTAHRLLLALESEGLVERNAGKYHLGPEVIALGSQALLTSDLRVRVRPTLERIAAKTGESTTLEVLVGDHVLILDGARGRHVVSASLEIGMRWPVHATSTGKCMLAQLPEASRKQLLGLSMPRFTEHTVTDPDLLVAELEATRSTGFAVANQELERDYVAIAAAFKGPMRDVEGAISVGGPASRFPPDRIEALGKVLRAEADELSRSRVSRTE
jgi:IclR family acetate operon transcriptional repressor